MNLITCDGEKLNCSNVLMNFGIKETFTNLFEKLNEFDLNEFNKRFNEILSGKFDTDDVSKLIQSDFMKQNEKENQKIEEEMSNPFGKLLY